MNFKDKTILVTGGAGFIGSHLCDELFKHEPKRLYIIDNLSASSLKNIEHLLKDKRVSFINENIVNSGTIHAYVRDSNIVFHLAASNVGNSILTPLIDLYTNIVGTFNVLQSAYVNNVRVIYASSGSVVNPSTPYAISKLAAENYCKFFAQEFGVKVSIVRYHHVFGPRQDINGKCGVINIFLARILQGKPPVIWGSGEQIKCFTYVQDSVNATLAVVRNDSTIGQIYDVAADTRISIKDLAHLLIKKYAEDKDMKPIYEEPKMGENMVLNPAVARIKMLGWKPEYSFEEGLDKCKEWVEEQLGK